MTIAISTGGERRKHQTPWTSNTFHQGYERAGGELHDDERSGVERRVDRRGYKKGGSVDSREQFEKYKTGLGWSASLMSRDWAEYHHPGLEQDWKLWQAALASRPAPTDNNSREPSRSAVDQLDANESSSPAGYRRDGSHQPAPAEGDAVRLEAIAKLEEDIKQSRAVAASWAEHAIKVHGCNCPQGAP